MYRKYKPQKAGKRGVGEQYSRTRDGRELNPKTRGGKYSPREEEHEKGHEYRMSESPLKEKKKKAGIKKRKLARH